VSSDWRKDNDERKRIIRAFIQTGDGTERDYFITNYPDIEAEAEEYKRQAGMKSD